VFSAEPDVPPALAPTVLGLSPIGAACHMHGVLPVALSLVIPAYNEAARIGKTLEEVRRYLDTERIDAEVLVVDDGSSDDTVSVVEQFSRADARIRLLKLPKNQGKGAAVRAGMLASRGERKLFMDADLATPMEELKKLARALDAGADIAIGSRGLPDSTLLVRQHPAREAMGRTFNLLVKAAGLRGIEDTQCGFKLFTRAAAEHLFSEARIERFAFDVELLLLARGRFSVAEVPVEWRHVQESRVSPIRDAARMAWDLARLRVDVALRKRK
jgi:glycosyltransferase involved in cell wall biosynthesis